MVHHAASYGDALSQVLRSGTEEVLALGDRTNTPAQKLLPIVCDSSGSPGPAIRRLRWVILPVVSGPFSVKSSTC
eukprot:1963583-Rhodomonas_salina.1